MRETLPLFIVGLLLLSGCTGSTPAPAEASQSPEVGNGGIQGLVVDDESRPIENATVDLAPAGLEALTGPDGAFEFSPVPEGAYVITATHPEFNETTYDVVVLRDLTVRAEFTMAQRPEYRPFNYTEQYTGSFQCAMEVLFIPGSCGILYENATCRLNYCQPDPLQSKYAFPINVKPRWDTILVEAVYTQAAGNQLDGIRVYLENANISGGAGHGTKVGRVDGGPQPLKLRVDRGIPGPGAETYEGTETLAFIPDDGGPEQVRVFPMGKFWEYTKQVCHPEIDGCLLGVGVGIDVKFTVYVTYFHNGSAPTSFSAAPK